MIVRWRRETCGMRLVEPNGVRHPNPVDWTKIRGFRRSMPGLSRSLESRRKRAKFTVGSRAACRAFATAEPPVSEHGERHANRAPARYRRSEKYEQADTRRQLAG